MTSVMFLAAQAAQQGGNMSFLFLMIAIFAVMWFFMIRPQQKKQKEIRKFQNSLQEGTKVVTGGGLYGTVKKIDLASNIIDVDIESEIKDLSVKSIKALLSQKNSKKEDEKKDGIQAIKDSYDVPLSPEEEAFLKTLPAKDILKLLNDSSKEEQKGEEKKNGK